MLSLATGATSISIDVQIVDDTGLPVTGLIASTFPTLTISRGTGADVAFPALSDLSALTDSFAAGGVKERGGGTYRLDVPNDVGSTAATKVTIRGESSGKRLICPPIQVGNLPSNALAIADGLITTAKIADGALTSAKFATGAFAAVWDSLTSGMTAAGSIGKKLADWVVGTIDTYTGNTKQTGDAFARLGANGAGLTALATQASVDDLPTNAELATALATADDAVLAAINALNNLSAAQVNAELLDVLTTDTFAELGAVPAATSSLKDKLTWLFQWARNKSTQTATQRKLYADDTTTVISTEAVSDDGTTFSKGEAA